MATPLGASGDEALRIAEETGRYIRCVEKALAEALSHHPHDRERLVAAIGAALLSAQETRHLNGETQELIRDERRRRGRRQETGG